MRGRWALAAIAALMLAAAAAPAALASSPRRVVIALAPANGSPGSELARLSAAGLDELGLMTASVSSYSQQQTLLDITQGARVPSADYSRAQAPALAVSREGLVRGWAAIAARAATADASIEPGLLAGSIPGGAAYATATALPGADAILAAARNGRIGAVSLGSSASLERRVERLLAAHSLVIVDLPGIQALRRLLATRSPDELLLVLERPPVTAPGASGAPQLLAVATAGLARQSATLRTATTRTLGLVSASDLAPTILHWLDLPVPAAMIGRAISAGPARSLSTLAAFGARLAVISARRLEALLAFLAAWLALAALALTSGRGLRGALRIGGLAALWTPVTVLAAAALGPGALVEITIVVGGAFALALATDALVPWPRAAAIPAFSTVGIYAGALLAGSGLVETSLLGSDPISGSRFFGAGNELTAVLAVELLVALAASLPQRRVSAREVVAVAVAGGLLTLLVAWGRAGANVGAIFTIGGATAAATIVLVPGRVTLRRVAWAAFALLAALAVLAALDLATGGGAQLTSQVLHAGSVGAALSAVGRRLAEAADALANPPVLVGVLVCLAAAAGLVAFRSRVLAPLGEANAWGACLAGSLTGSLLGSLAADSGPRVLLVGCCAAACALAYVGAVPSTAAKRSYWLFSGADDTENRVRHPPAGPAHSSPTRGAWAMALRATSRR